MAHLLSLYAHHRVNATGDVAAALQDKKEQQSAGRESRDSHEPVAHVPFIHIPLRIR